METKDGWLGHYFHFGVQPYFQDFSYFVVTKIHPGRHKKTFDTQMLVRSETSPNQEPRGT